MRKLLCLILFLLTYSFSQAQIIVSGSVQLESNNDPSSTVLVLNGYSEGAQSQNCSVDSDGSYSCEVQPGIYTLHLFAPNHQIHEFYDGLPITLIEDLQLASTTLEQMSVSAIVLQSELNNGIISSDMSVAVLAETTAIGNLEILPGARLVFGPNGRLSGNITAIGTADNPIIFEGGNAGILSVEGSNSVFEHCHFSVDSLLTNSGEARFEHCILDDLFMKQTHVELISCSADTIILQDASSLNVDCSRLNNIRAFEIDDLTVQNGELSSINLFGNVGEIKIRNNFLGSILGQGDEYELFSVQNCLFDVENFIPASFNTPGIAFFLTQSPVLIKNNLFQQNDFADAISFVMTPDPDLSVPDVSYNLFSHPNPISFSSYYPPDYNEHVAVNMQGDSIDVYNNQHNVDLGFIVDFYPIIDASSPAQNAGDPTLVDLNGPDAGINLATYCLTDQYDLVWPGDTNWDLKVTMADLFQIGLHYNMIGPQRPNANTEWEGQAAEDWNVVAVNPVDLKHSDCDGNGVIDKMDLVAIEQNYSQLHEAGKTNDTSDGETLLYLEGPESVLPGDTVELRIMLGTEEFPASQFYGISFGLQFDPIFLQPGTVETSFADSWVGEFEEEFIALGIPLDSLGRIDIGICRINLWPVASGSGQVGMVTYIVNEDIIGKENLDMKIDLVNVEGVSRQGDFIRYDHLEATIALNVRVDSGDLLDIAPIIYPVPGNQYLHIDMQSAEIHSLEILDFAGEIMLEESDSAPINTRDLDISALAPGFYFVRIKDQDQRTHFARFLKQ